MFYVFIPWFHFWLDASHILGLNRTVVLNYNEMIVYLLEFMVCRPWLFHLCYVFSFAYFA